MEKKGSSDDSMETVFMGKNLHILYCGKTLFISHDMQKLKDKRKILEDKYPGETIHVSYIQEIEAYFIK